jgi:hypothetical protein
VFQLRKGASCPEDRWGGGDIKRRGNVTLSHGQGGCQATCAGRRNVSEDVKKHREGVNIACAQGDTNIYLLRQ